MEDLLLCHILVYELPKRFPMKQITSLQVVKISAGKMSINATFFALYDGNTSAGVNFDETFKKLGHTCKLK